MVKWMDKIIIKGLRLFAYHGVRAHEKQNGQTFILDITLFLPLKTPGQTDALTDTVSYSAVSRTAAAIFTENRFDLIERAADAVASGILHGYPAIRQVTVCVKKPEAPVQADFDYMAVEITRSAEDLA